MVKEIAGAGIVMADIIAAFATPDVIKILHSKPESAAYAPAGIAVVLIILTLWVVTSIVRNLGNAKADRQNARAAQQSARRPYSRIGQ